jgi:hypothetical protein
MRAFVLLTFLALCSFVAVASRTGSRAEYIGGTVGTIPTSNLGDIQLTDQIYFKFSSKITQMRIPYERINLVEYGQKVDRRYLTAAIISPLFLMAKKREHFLTIGYQDDDGHQQALIFKVNKNDIRQTLVELEARTGQKVGYQDEDARKDPKG